MLAEIFLLRLEAAARVAASNSSGNSGFVPVVLKAKESK